MRLRYTRLALADLDSLLDYIAADAPRAAARVHARIQAVANLLLQHPLIGATTDDPTVRRVAVNHQVALEPASGRAAIRAMFAREFAAAKMVCIPENIFEDGVWAILEWRDPLGLRGCGFFKIAGDKIAFQRGYWDKLSFLKLHGLPLDGA